MLQRSVELLNKIPLQKICEPHCTFYIKLLLHLIGIVFFPLVFFSPSFFFFGSCRRKRVEGTLEREEFVAGLFEIWGREAVASFRRVGVWSSLDYCNWHPRREMQNCSLLFLTQGSPFSIFAGIWWWFGMLKTLLTVAGFFFSIVFGLCCWIIKNAIWWFFKNK